jgi:hypothetical protein
MADLTPAGAIRMADPRRQANPCRGPGAAGDVLRADRQGEATRADMQRWAGRTGGAPIRREPTDAARASVM